MYIVARLSKDVQTVKMQVHLLWFVHMKIISTAVLQAYPSV